MIEQLNTSNEHIDDLIGKVLSGEATAAELALLNEWMAESAENALYFKQVKSLFDTSNASANAIPFDVDAAWNKVRTRINTKAKRGRVIPLHSKQTIWVWRIAAALVVLIGLGVVLYQSVNQEIPHYALQSLDSVVKDTLSDGSTAVLNKQTELTFSHDVKGKVRIATLKGEAFFEVKHNDQEKFIIHSDELRIEDIGTSFNVKALPGADSAEVYLKEGVVRIYTNAQDGITLQAGETGIYVRSKKEFIKKETTSETEAGAYATHDFKFRNARLEKVIRKLNEVYETKIELSSAVLNDCRISVNFNDDDIETIAQVIAESLGLSVEIKNGKLLLSGEGC